MIRRRNAHDGESPVAPWWVKDWLTSKTVLRMPRAARSLYHDLLLRQWLDGSIPPSTRDLALLSGETHGAFLKMWAHVGPCFKVGTDGQLRNDRMAHEREEDEAFRSAKAEAGKNGAAKRWQKDGSANGSAIDPPLANGSPPPPPPRTSSVPTVPPRGARSSRSKRALEDPERGRKHQAFIAWWGEAFQASCGVPYGFDHGKDAAAVAAILDLAGGSIELAQNRALALLHAAPGWIDEGGRDLCTLRSQWNRLASMGTGRTSGSKQLAIQDALKGVPASSGLLEMPTARRA